MIEWHRTKDELPKHDCRVLVWIEISRGKRYCLVGNYYNKHPDFSSTLKKVFVVDVSKFDKRLTTLDFYERNKKDICDNYMSYCCSDLKLTHWASINKPEVENEN